METPGAAGCRSPCALTRDVSGSVPAEDVDRLYAALNEAAVIQALEIPGDVTVSALIVEGVST